MDKSVEFTPEQKLLGSTIQQIIEEGNGIIEHISRYSQKPNPYSKAYWVTAFYGEDEEREMTSLFKKWQLTSKAKLGKLYDSNDELFKEYVQTVTNAELVIGDKRRNITMVIKKGIDVLESMLTMITNNPQMQSAEMIKQTKTPKIFISHSTRDKAIVDDLIRLLEFLGIKGKDMIFCSSHPGYGVRSNENIYERIRSEYETHDLYMIYMLSDNYLNSRVSLNEMGGAWIMRNKHQVFLLPKLSYEILNTVCIRSDEMSIRWDGDDTYAMMNDFKDSLLETFAIPQPDNTIWETRRKEFIDAFRKHQSEPIEGIKQAKIEEPEPKMPNQPKALIVGRSVYNGKGAADIYFANKGTGTACQFKVEFEENKGICYRDDNIFPYEYLKPHHEIKVHAAIFTSFNGVIKAHLEWFEDGVRFSDEELIQVL